MTEHASAAATSPKVIGRPFAKGTSGNPAGRPRVAADLRQLCQSKGREAFDRLCELMRSKDEKVSLAAIRELLDRGYGRAAPADDDGAAAPVVVNIVRFTERGDTSVEIDATPVRRLTES